MLKYVRKKGVNSCLIEAYEENGEGCESKKCKIPVGRAYAHARERGFKSCWELNFDPKLALNPNRSLDRYSANRYGEDNFLASFIFLLASCFSFVLDAFKLMKNHLLNHQIKSVQNLMTDWGYILNKLGLIKHEKEMLQKRVLQHLLLWIGMEGATRL